MPLSKTSRKKNHAYTNIHFYMYSVLKHTPIHTSTTKVYSPERGKEEVKKKKQENIERCVMPEER